MATQLHSGINQIWKQIPWRTQLLFLCSSNSCQGRDWEKAISYCGLGDRTAHNVEDGLDENGEY